jgi:hypothetical protein
MVIIDIGQGRRVELDAERDETRVFLPNAATADLAANLEKSGFAPDSDRKVWVRDLDEHTLYLAKHALRAAS